MDYNKLICSKKRMIKSTLPWWVSILLTLFVLSPGLAVSQTCSAPPGWLDQSETPACDGADGAEAPPCNACLGGNTSGGSGGMMRASVQSLLVSLAISDRPLDYRPAKGPAVPLSFYYSQREAYQPESFHYSNLGPKWTYSGLSYLVDDPNTPEKTCSATKRVAARASSKKRIMTPPADTLRRTGKTAPCSCACPIRYATNGAGPMAASRPTRTATGARSGRVASSSPSAKTPREMP